MTTAQLPPSVSNYGNECRRILSWMTGEWLSADKFDALSIEAGPEIEGERWYTPESIMLPIWGDGRLALVQEMMRLGLIEARKSAAGSVEYRHVLAS